MRERKAQKKRKGQTRDLVKYGTIRRCVCSFRFYDIVCTTIVCQAKRFLKLVCHRCWRMLPCVCDAGHCTCDQNRTCRRCLSIRVFCYADMCEWTWELYRKLCAQQVGAEARLFLKWHIRRQTRSFAWTNTEFCFTFSNTCATCNA